MYYFLLFLSSSYVLLFMFYFVVWAFYGILKPEQKNEFAQEQQEAPAIPAYIVISFFNEASILEKKIQNLRELDYPALKFIFVDDFSQDNSSEIVQSFQDKRIVLLKNTRKGKTHAQNLAVSQIPENTIIIFNDCNVFLEKSSIRKLVQAFGKDVGGISANVTIWEAENHRKGLEGEYWEWEKKLKLLESSLGVVIGFDGGFYAIRSQLYTPLAPDALSDFEQAIDVLAQGYKVIYCNEVRASEFEYRELRSHFLARRRVTVRTLWALERTLKKLGSLSIWGCIFLAFNKYMRYFCFYVSPLFFGCFLWYLYQVNSSLSYIFLLVVGLLILSSFYIHSLQRLIALFLGVYAGLFTYILRKKVISWGQQRR